MPFAAKFSAISMENLAAMTFQLVLFGVCFASIAFGIGAYTGRRLNRRTTPRQQDPRAGVLTMPPGGAPIGCL